jgi:hypothetical protein
MYDFIFFTDLTDTIYIAKTIGPFKCAHVLRSAGYSCLVIDHLHAFDYAELTTLIDKVFSNKTVAVGFSTTFYKNSNVDPNPDGSLTYTEFLGDSLFPQGKEFEKSILSYIKNISPNCKVMVGGANVRGQYQNRTVDYAFVGFSEGTMINLANHLVKGETLNSAIKNIWGVTVLDDRTASTHDFKNTNFSWQSTDVVNAKSLPIEIARGCIFKCKFCSYPMNGKQNLDFVKSIELLRQELQDTYDRYGVTTYSIVDDTFNDNDYKLNLILEAVKQLTFQPKFWAYTRIDLLHTKKQIDKLYDIGLRGFYFGIETLHQESSRLIGKGYAPKKQIAAIKDLRNRYGNEITMHGSFMIGLPKDSLENVTKTFEQLMDGTIPLHSFDFKALTLDRLNRVNWASELSTNFEKYGYIDQGTIYNKYVDWKNDYTTFKEAHKLELEFRKTFQNSANYHLPGQPIWSLVNYGYELNYLTNLLHKDIPWHDLAQHKREFITEYKKQLNALIDARLA